MVEIVTLTYLRTHFNIHAQLLTIYGDKMMEL